MPTYVKGNVFNSNNDVIVITTNGCIDSKGELVMGRGAALEAKRFYPSLPKHAGNAIKRYTYLSNKKCYLYGYLQLRVNGSIIGLFQTKYHWSEPAYLSLIEESTLQLSRIARISPLSYALNFPGIGYGGLARESVLPILSMLPGNVHIYEL